MTVHPDFEAAPPERRFSGGTLKALFARLDAEAAQRPERRPYFVLRSGALVSMRYLDNGKRELVISRSTKPQVTDGLERWRTEVDTFVRYFDVPHWTRTDDPNAKGVRVILREPEGLLCADCHAPLDEIAIAAMAEVCCACAEARKRAERDEASRLVPCSGGCGQMVVYDPGFPPDGQNCFGCGVAIGNEHTRQVKARIAAERAAKAV